MDGEVLVDVPAEGGKVKTIALGRGQFFGELGLLSGRRRSNTLSAGAGCVLIETPRSSMLKLIAGNASVRRQIDETSLRRAVRMQIAPHGDGARGG